MKKTIFITSALLAMSLTAIADLHPVSNDKGKWGYADDNGTMVIKYKFAGASDFSDGIAMVREGNKYGIIDESGNYTIKPKYDMITPFNSFGLAEVMQGDKHGFINKSGNLVIQCKYKYVGAFNQNGLVWVNEGGNIKKGTREVAGGKFSIYRADGTNHLGEEFGCIGKFIPWVRNYTSDELDKMTITERRLTEGANHSFWRKSSISFIPNSPLPTEITAFYASKGSDGYYNGVYEPDGRTIVPAGKYYFANYPENGISIVWPNKKSRNFLDVATGQHILSSPIEDCWGFNDNFCIGFDGGLAYIYGRDGQKKSAGYTAIYPANSGTHVVRNGKDKYGLISTNGTELIKPENYSVYPCIEGASLVKKTSSSPVGYVNNQGVEIIPAIYSSGMNFKAGHAMVEKDKKWGMIDKIGNELIPAEYDNMKINGDADNKLFWCLRTTGGLWECYDIEKKSTVIPAGYQDVRPFDITHSNLALVKAGADDNTWGWIDKNGTVKIPCRFDTDLVFKAAKEYVDSGKLEWTEYRDYLFRLHNMKINVPISEKADESLWDY